MANPTPPSQTPIANNNFQQVTNLTAIQTKVRRLTRSPSPAQLTDADLNNYINTFVVYDFPEQIRTFNLRRPFSFVCNPFQDEYNTDILSFGGNTTNQLVNFQNLYMTIHPPFYVAGFESFYTQDRTQFFRIYPKINNVLQTGNTGANPASAGPYVGVINTQQLIAVPGFTQNLTLLQNNILFNAIGINGVGLSLVDIPIVDPVSGYKTNTGNLYDPNSAAYRAALINPPVVGGPVNPNGTINYITGVYNITFSAPVLPGAIINSETVPVSTSRPQSILFYNNMFTLRPVPDQAYTINFEVYQRPVALGDPALNLGYQMIPELEEYWQYIAYGASKKIFEDKMDLESVQMIMPEFKQQERLVLRRTLVQHSNARTSTIYTEQTNTGLYGGGFYYGGGNF